MGVQCGPDGGHHPGNAVSAAAGPSFPKTPENPLKRLGATRIPRTATRAPRPIWIHALSVGEVRTALPLVRGLKTRFPERPIVFSTSTWAGHLLAAQCLESIEKPAFFFPYDWRPSVRTVVNRVDPALVLILETDLWPNFMECLGGRNIPLILVNARISHRSYARYRRFQPWVRSLFGRISAVCAPTDGDARRFALLGVPRHRIRITGNLKYEYVGPEKTPLEMELLKKALGFGAHQKIVAAGSTHKGEETEILAAFLKIRERFPDARMLLAPRDPGRAAAVGRMVAASGVRTVLLSAHEKGGSTQPECLVVDRLGVLNRLYGASDMAFIGGSLVREGGHNPLEPAAWGKPILFGPDMSDFASIAETLMASGGAVRIQDRDSLADAVLDLMAHPEAAESMGRCALNVAMEGKGALEKILDVAAAYLIRSGNLSAKRVPVDTVSAGCVPFEERLPADP